MDDETTGKMPDQNTGETPDAEQTAVAPPADEGATQVLSGEAADLTQVMPAAGGAGTPPPPPIEPTLVMARPKKKGGGRRTWIWVVVAIVVIAALAATAWFFLLRPGNGGDEFVGTWSPAKGGGGGLIITKSGSGFEVTQYDAELVAIGSTTADLVDDELTASIDASALGLTSVAGKVDGTLTHEASSDQLSLRFSSGSLSSKTEQFMRVDVLRPVSPSPSPTLSPTPTFSPSSTGSPSPSGSPSASSDQQVIDAIIKIQVGVITWATNNNNLYPASAEVSQSGGVAQYVDPWPVNPVTNQPMTPGTQAGDYTYEQLNGGQGYKLTGYLGNGLTYTVP